MLGACVERVQAGSLFERLTDLVVGRRSRDEFGVPLKIITALPEASWRVVWGSSARVARTVSLQGACSVRVLSVSPLEVCWND